MLQGIGYVCVRQAALLILDDSDPIQPFAEEPFQELHHLLQASMRGSDDNVWAIACILAWQQSLLNLWPKGITGESQEV